MGACITSNHIKESQKSTVTSPTSIRAQINAEINKENMRQSYVKPFPREKDINSNKQGGLNAKQKQRIKEDEQGLTVDIIEDRNNSSSAVEIGNDSGARVIRHVVISKNCLNKLDQFSKKKSIKSQSFKSQNGSSPQQIINPLQQTTFQNSNSSQIQTIQSRINAIDQNMLGKGLKLADNKMIELTQLVNKPLSLSAIKLKNGSTYYGEWLKGQREGYGVLVWQDGSRYEGQWHLNCSQGQGKLIYNKQQHYQGHFFKNCRHGYGVYINNQKSYKGQWKNDKKQGRGIENFGNKQYYEGQWLAGKKNGFGELHFQDGSYYKGHFSSNQIHGHGYYQWKDTKTYEGSWKHNTMCGKGHLKWTNGDEYEGYFKNNKMHGNGIYTHADGRVSEGYYQNGKKQGLFVQINSQKRAIEVEYLMGKIKQKNSKRKHQRTDSKTLSSATSSV